MATNKNITMKQFNGTDYDTLYPKTVAAQIPDVFSQSETVNAEMLSKYGLGASGTPNDVFGVLSRFQNGLGNEYVWEKGTYIDNLGTESTSSWQGICQSYPSTANLYYADTLYDLLKETGTYKILTVPAYTSGDYSSTINSTTANKWVKSAPNYNVYFFNDGSRVAWGGSGSSYIYYISGTFYQNPSIDFELVSYVNSPNSSAYPPAVSDGYAYRELGQIAKKLNVYNIREITTEAQASTVEIDISDLDLNEWEFLVAELVPASGNGGGVWWAKGTGLGINNMHYTSMGDLNSSTAGLGPVSDFTRNTLHTYMVLMLHKNKAQNMKALTFGPNMSYGNSSDYTFNSISSIVIAGTSEDYYLSAGAKIYLWGVK